MAKTITYNSKFYIHDGKDWLDICPAGMKTRTYHGDFVTAMQNFYPDGTMEFVFFSKKDGKQLTTYNRAQMNDIIGIMEIISQNKDEFYPKEFLT